MARKKIIKRKPKVLPKLIIKRARKPKVADVPVSNIPTPPIEKVVPLTPVKYDGAEVVAILAVGETAKHCQMSDGTSKWIPKSAFNE
jgi:hypothetical protein